MCKIRIFGEKFLAGNVDFGGKRFGEKSIDRLNLCVEFGGKSLYILVMENRMLNRNRFRILRFGFRSVSVSEFQWPLCATILYRYTHFQEVKTSKDICI